jgi:hypothetical protein
MQRFIDAALVGAQRAATLQHEHNLAVIVVADLVYGLERAQDSTLGLHDRSFRRIGRCSMRGPATIDRNCGAGDGGSSLRAQEYGDAAKFIGSGEALIWLLREQQIADHLLAGNTMSLGLAIDLRLNQRGVDIAWANRIAGDAHLGGLERSHLSQAEHPVLSRDVGGP